MPVCRRRDGAVTAATIDVACLCAAWCRLCDDYALVIEQVRAEFDPDGIALRWHWIDIEDQAELLGEVDVETFPTIVIADPAVVRFAGPLMPQAETLRRVLRATVQEVSPDTRWPAVGSEIESFVRRLQVIATSR